MDTFTTRTDTKWCPFSESNAEVWKICRAAEVETGRGSKATIITMMIIVIMMTTTIEMTALARFDRLINSRTRDRRRRMPCDDGCESVLVLRLVLRRRRHLSRLPHPFYKLTSHPSAASKRNLFRLTIRFFRPVARPRQKFYKKLKNQRKTLMSDIR